jgi:hypothetical protein
MKEKLLGGCKMKTYIDYVYEIVEEECKDIDAIYEDFIVQLVGTRGLYALINCRLLEACGVLHGRQLYTLLEKKGK